MDTMRAVITGGALFAALMSTHTAHAQTATEVLSQGGFCIAHAISDDGKTVALTVQKTFDDITMGYNPEAMHRAAVWNSGKIKNLDTGDYGLSAALDVSADGRIVTGVVRLAKNKLRSVRWQDGKFGSLPLPQFYTTETGGISSDGKTIVAHKYFDKKFTGLIWQDNEVREFAEPNLPYAVSADGKVIVGGALYDGKKVQAAVWRQGEMSRLLDDVTLSEALAVSNDGRSIIVRYQNWVPHVEHGIKLVMDDTVLDLLPQAAGIRPLHMAISGNGKMVAASLLDTSDYSKPAEIAVWDAARRWERTTLPEILTQAGAKMDKWQLQVPIGMSNDGSVMVGNGKYNGRQMPWLLDFSGKGPPILKPLCP